MALYNAIGPFQMLFIEGQILLPVMMSERVERPGVNGVGMLRTGRRGPQFKLRSKVDALDIFDADNLLREYESIVGGDPILIAQNDIPFTQGFYVEAMIPVVCRAIVGGVGGLNENPGAWVEADWHLSAIGD
jgi:hypothetical protein